MNITNLSGKKFNKLTALSISHKDSKGVYWNFLCDCGKTITHLGSTVSTNRVKSCGCLKFKDLIGSVSGKLTVISSTGKMDSSSRKLYNAKCDCGNVVEVSTTDITMRRKNSCGCTIPTLEGKKFGFLTVIKKTGGTHSRGVYECVCDCGNHIFVDSQTLKRKFSCGCHKKQIGYKDVTTSYWKSVVAGAMARNLEISITAIDAYEKLSSQNFKCALSGVSIAIYKRHQGETTASLDRIDSSKGYSISNIQWVHKNINAMKSNLAEQDFIAWCGSVFFNSMHKQKPSWDLYFITLCKVVASRSMDPSTKHGCIIVDENHRVLSLGYNGPPQGIDDSVVPTTRPEKYNWMLHAEENALLFCYQSIQGSTVYITGKPCVLCLRKLIQKGVKRIVFGTTTSKCMDTLDAIASAKMVEESGIILSPFIA